MASQLPNYANITTDQDLNYLVALNQDKDFNVHYIRDDRVAVLRDCHDDGSLKSIKKNDGKSPWVLLLIKEFEDEGFHFDVPVCTRCCPLIESFSKKQNFNVITSQLCNHAKMLKNIVRDFKNPHFMQNWLSLSKDLEDGAKIEIIHKKEENNCSSQHLAIVFDKSNKIGLLWTAGRMLTPSCTLCSSPKCKHYHLWKNDEILKETSKDTSENVDDITDPEPHPHYNNEHGYGYNRSAIVFPILDDPTQKEAFEKRKDGRYGLPEEIIPDIPELHCKHGKTFSQAKLKFVSSTVTIFHDQGETIVPCQVYARLSSCRCQYHPDLHPWLLFNTGAGRCVDYETLQKHLIMYCRTGCTTQGYYNNISSHSKLMGKKLETEYKNLVTAMDGFVQNIAWNKEEIFSCPQCGISPAYLVGDGKCDLAPLQRRLPKGVKEFSPHPNDPSPVLKQATKHSDRIFLKEKSERDMIISLVQGKVTVSEILNCKKKKSDNFILIGNLLNRIKDCEEIPFCYQELLIETSKNTPVAGIFQVTQRKTLKLLRQFCLKEVNFRDGMHHQELKILMSDLPAIFPIIIRICNLEDSDFLPTDINRIILSLLRIRISTFTKSEVRYQEDYIPYEGGEDCTQFYPNFPIQTWPKLYNVGSSIDKMSCEKNFSSHSQFLDGIFSIGCACKYSITYGFELMLHSESPRHFFHFLTSRQINYRELRGVIFDYACGLHQYILNREPAQFETVQFLVDGSHWQSMKKKVNKTRPTPAQVDILAAQKDITSTSTSNTQLKMEERRILKTENKCTVH